MHPTAHTVILQRGAQTVFLVSLQHPCFSLHRTLAWASGQLPPNQLNIPTGSNFVCLRRGLQKQLTASLLLPTAVAALAAPHLVGQGTDSLRAYLAPQTCCSRQTEKSSECAPGSSPIRDPGLGPECSHPTLNDHFHRQGLSVSLRWSSQRQ